MIREPNLVVDGYNLMHQIVSPRGLSAPGGLLRARQRVVQRVASLLQVDQLTETMIVFDADGLAVGETSGDLATGSAGIQVVFANDFPDADSMIESIITRHSSPPRLTIVSSDRRLIDAANRRGATGMDCQSWLDLQESNRDQAERVDEAPQFESLRDQVPNPDEARYWLREFGFDNDDDS